MEGQEGGKTMGPQLLCCCMDTFIVACSKMLWPRSKYSHIPSLKEERGGEGGEVGKVMDQEQC